MLTPLVANVDQEVEDIEHNINKDLNTTTTTAKGRGPAYVSNRFILSQNRCLYALAD